MVCYSSSYRDACNRTATCDMLLVFWFNTDAWLRVKISFFFFCSFFFVFLFFLMIRRPPRSTLDRSSAASDVYKRQKQRMCGWVVRPKDGFIPQLSSFKFQEGRPWWRALCGSWAIEPLSLRPWRSRFDRRPRAWSVSYTHLRAHETVLDLVCRLLLETKKLQ